MKVILGILIIIICVESLAWYGQSVNSRRMLKWVEGNRDEYVHLYDSIRNEQWYISRMDSTFNNFSETEDTTYCHLRHGGRVEWTNSRQTVVYRIT